MNNRIISLLLCLFITATLFASSPKYIFYFIGDGMGVGPAMATETYNRQVLKNDNSILMMQFPVASVAMTYSHENPITDSAAAGTALATGHKTRNGMIGMTADSVAVKSIAKLLNENGYGAAINTSVFIDDATPCAFYANTTSRKNYYEICQDLLNRDFEFFGGAALRGKKDNHGKAAKLYQNLKKKG